MASEQSSDDAVRIQHVSKSFKLPHEKTTSIKSLVIHLFRKKREYELQEALNDVNFDIKKGEFFGIVGRNGSGKSTLLKMIAGIYSPSQGKLEVLGALTPFIELGVGFNPELTGKENVYMNGALLGFNRKEVSAMYDDIVEFAEIERFMDQKLKNYSSGMQVRLAFSIAIRAKTDILLIDEVLAVGDESFQQKCFATFEKLKAQKKTIVFVSHSMGAIQKFCNRVALLHNGKLVAVGNPKKISEMYNRLNQDNTEKIIREENTKSQSTSVLKVDIADKAGQPTTTFDYGDELCIRLSWPKDVPAQNAGVALYKQSGEYIYGTNTILDKVKIADNKVSYRVKLNVGDGNYVIVAGLFGERAKDIIELTADGLHFQVLAKKRKQWEGLVDLQHEWSA